MIEIYFSKTDWPMKKSFFFLSLCFLGVGYIHGLQLFSTKKKQQHQHYHYKLYREKNLEEKIKDLRDFYHTDLEEEKHFKKMTRDITYHFENLKKTKSQHNGNMKVFRGFYNLLPLEENKSK